MSQYPRMLYRDLTLQDYKTAESEQDQETLESQGYQEYDELAGDSASDQPMTKPQIIEKLTELGVEFNPRDKKEELLLLLSLTENPET